MSWLIRAPRVGNFKTIVTLSHKIIFITFSVPLYFMIRAVSRWDVEWRIKIENEMFFFLLFLLLLLSTFAGRQEGDERSGGGWREKRKTFNLIFQQPSELYHEGNLWYFIKTSCSFETKMVDAVEGTSFWYDTVIKKLIFTAMNSVHLEPWTGIASLKSR